MERGVKLLRRIIVAALLLGALVIIVHPDYRHTFQAMWADEVERSAIWESNREYYREVAYEMDVRHEDAE
jgi:hypothetical protein